ncbi:MAG: DUF370 domain-containing protein, partial [Candidatus Obscuribacterales bacterium]|nr:DUF370 domain-containing protein [Candidatus Obscuribacterales bacterium]
CIEPGKLKQTATAKSGPVKRYLAYNVPAGAFVATKTILPPKSQPLKPIKKAQPQHNEAVIMSYGRKSGEITYSVAHARPCRSGAISYYPSYH